jgi:hypothetical protein
MNRLEIFRLRLLMAVRRIWSGACCMAISTGGF